MEKYLIIGSDGLIGSALLAHLHNQKNNVTATTRRIESANNKIHYDLSQPKPHIFQDYTHAFICAGITNINACEADPAGTSAINIDATIQLAKELLYTGCRVIFISSNTVFDGSIQNPNENTAYQYSTEYGRQKAETEQQLLSLNNNTAIVRISKVISNNTPTVAKIIANIKAGQHCEVFNDLLFSPITIGYLCKNLIKIATSKNTGIFHLSGTHDISYADFAFHIAKKTNTSTEFIHSIPANSVFFKPKYAGLGMQRTTGLLNILPQNTNEALTNITFE
jgi:dTDP-4-dehydrorhamnose reductase